MLFSSLPFIAVFLPAVWIGYHSLQRLGRPTAARTWLVVSSLTFYGWWHVEYIPLLIGSMAVNYLIGQRLGKHPGQLRLLVGGVLFNLALLGYFKYAGFVVENLITLGLASPPAPHIALPLAISFFTFQQIAYLVDSQRGETREYSPQNYALFVTFFPQLIAGPIVHHREMMPQFDAHDQAKRHGLGRFAPAGLALFALGLAKKVLIADTFAVWADQGFTGTAPLHLLSAWAISLSYSLQLYFDFAGYSDMAMGAALLFGIRLPLNFRSPYLSLNIQDFWRRWHMTLSSFLRSYLYIPLGGNRHGEARTALALFVTFVLGGLWHGASWMFVLWGVLHGTAIVLHRQWRRTGLRLRGSAGWVLTFVFVNAAWVVFRAPDLTSASRIFKGMIGANGVALPASLPSPIREIAQGLGLHIAPSWGSGIGGNTDGILLWLFLALVGIGVLRKQDAMGSHIADEPRDVWQPSRWQVVILAVLAWLAIALLAEGRSSPFLYFEF